MTTDPDKTEQLLRDILAPLTEDAQHDPDAARRVVARWKQRERKRRLIIATLIAVIFTTAVTIGLWVLNRADPGVHIIFSSSATIQLGDQVGTRRVTVVPVPGMRSEVRR
ncbi:MAG: hypothetical protein ACRDTX_12500 [Pseudonocardiaceae bacterium]